MTGATGLATPATMPPHATERRNAPLVARVTIVQGLARIPSRAQREQYSQVTAGYYLRSAQRVLMAFIPRKKDPGRVRFAPRVTHVVRPT